MSENSMRTCGSKRRRIDRVKDSLNVSKSLIHEAKDERISLPLKLMGNLMNIFSKKATDFVKKKLQKLKSYKSGSPVFGITTAFTLHASLQHYFSVSP